MKNPYVLREAGIRSALKGSIPPHRVAYLVIEQLQIRPRKPEPGHHRNQHAARAGIVSIPHGKQVTQRSSKLEILPSMNERTSNSWIKYVQPRKPASLKLDINALQFFQQKRLLSSLKDFIDKFMLVIVESNSDIERFSHTGCKADEKEMRLTGAILIAHFLRDPSKRVCLTAKQIHGICRDCGNRDSRKRDEQSNESYDNRPCVPPNNTMIHTWRHARTKSVPELSKPLHSLLHLFFAHLATIDRDIAPRQLRGVVRVREARDRRRESSDQLLRWTANSRCGAGATSHIGIAGPKEEQCT